MRTVTSPDPLNILNNKINKLEWEILALFEYIVQKDPEAALFIKKQAFYRKCWSYMMGRHLALKKAPLELTLQISTANKSVIDDLRKEAEASGWMDEFNRAEQNSSREAQEMYES